MVEPASEATLRRLTVFSILTLVLVVLASLLIYKWGAAFRTVAKVQVAGAYWAPPELIPAAGLPFLLACGARTINYLATVWPALLFGVLIAGLVRAFVSAEDVAKLLGSGAVRQQMAGGVVGMPLMLCACCIAPIFTSVHARGARLSTSLAIMLSSPSLNVAALILTFLLFPQEMAVTRAAMAIFGVFVLPAVIERVAPDVPARAAHQNDGGRLLPQNPLQVFGRWLTSSGEVAARTLPLIIPAVFLSALFVGRFAQPATHDLPESLVIAGVAFFATLIALPTFFEIPLAVLLMSNGFPAGAVVAMLFAGPAINLPSVFTLARVLSGRVALLAFVGVWIIATLGGMLFQFWRL